MKITPGTNLSAIFLVISLLQLDAAVPYSFNEKWEARYYQKPVSSVTKNLSVNNAPSATISTNLSNVISNVLPTQFGVNTTFRNGSDQRSRSNLYDGVVRSLRFPAGSGSNTYFWDGNIPESMKTYIDQNGTTQDVTGINGVNNNYMATPLFLKFVKDVNGEPIVVVNYFYARYGTTASATRAARVQQAADYAASWVRKMNIDLGGSVKYWEIGNECYGKWEVGYQINDATVGIVTGKEYGEDFRVFVAAMKAVDPTIKIGVVVKDEDDSWNQQVLQEVKDYADFLSVHQYFTTDKDATSANILNSTGKIAEIKTVLQNCIKKYTGKDINAYPIALTEFNARGSYNCSMVNGVFISQILGEIIKNGIGYSALWVSEWNWSDSALESKGFLAKADPEQDDYTPRQSYIPFYYYGKCFGDKMVESTSTNTGVVSYASVFSSGEAGMVLINKSASSKSVKLNFSDNNGNIPVKNIWWYEFTANTIEPTVSGYKKFYINGVTSATSGGGPADLNTVLPYHSSYSANQVFNLPAYSVLFLVADTGRVTSGLFNETKNNFLYFNDDRICCNDPEFTSMNVFDLTGKLILSSEERETFINSLKTGNYLVNLNFRNKRYNFKYQKYN